MLSSFPAGNISANLVQVHKKPGFLRLAAVRAPSVRPAWCAAQARIVHGKIPSCGVRWPKAGRGIKNQNLSRLVIRHEPSIYAAWLLPTNPACTPLGSLPRAQRLSCLAANPAFIVKLLIKSNELKLQGIHISQPPWFPQPFDPCPVLYRVEIRAIGWTPQHRMSLSLQRIKRVLPLVEGGVVHHDHAARG